MAPERLAEAGVWIARLHGDARGRGLENGLRRWLQADPENTRAFELATEVWDEAENLRRFVPSQPAFLTASRRRWTSLMAAAVVAVVTLVAGLAWYQQRGVISTAVGEQRQVELADGTRVLLNTNTRVVVQYDENTRRVRLDRGEALFDVAKRPEWPFVVVVGGRQVRALGTSFVVRTEAQVLAVILMEGKVTVAPRTAASATADAAADAKSERKPANEILTLAPGQRVTFASGAAAKLDTPPLDVVTAWRSGQVILDDTPLRVAAQEMNRYNSIKLVITDVEAGELLITGLFQAGDSARFANAMAQAYGLTVTHRRDEIALSGPSRH